MAVLRGTAPILVWVGAVLVVLCIFFVGARLYTRAFVNKRMGYNDVLITIALASFGGLYACLVVGAVNGIGGSLSQATLPGIIKSLEMIWFLENIYVVLTSCMKVSIALAFIDFSTKKWLVWAFRLSIVLDFLISAVFVIYLIAQCQPVEFAWTQLAGAKGGHCLPIVNQLYLGYALSFVTLALDTLFLTTPWFLMKGRNLTPRVKAGIYTLYAFGLMATAANLIRLSDLRTLQKSIDQLSAAAPVFLWSGIEVSIGIMIAGAMECGPLLHYMGIKGFEIFDVNKSFAVLDDDAEPLKLKTFASNVDGRFMDRDLHEDSKTFRTYQRDG